MDQGIARLHYGDRMVIFYDDRGNNELIGNTLVIGLLDGFYCRVGMLPFAACHGEIGHARTVPAIVTVHCIIAPTDRRYFCSMCATNFACASLKLPHKLDTAGRRGITAIGE